MRRQISQAFAMTIPARTATSPRKRLANMFAVAVTHDPSSKSACVSNSNVEKVVNAPRNPTPSASRNASELEAAFCATITPRTPNRNDPLTSIAKVPQGNRDSKSAGISYFPLRGCAWSVSDGRYPCTEFQVGRDSQDAIGPWAWSSADSEEGTSGIQ
jgi:hypothetical protein